MQDQWQGPKSFADRALLFFGDPLQTVEVKVGVLLTELQPLVLAYTSSGYEPPGPAAEERRLVNAGSLESDVPDTGLAAVCKNSEGRTFWTTSQQHELGAGYNCTHLRYRQIAELGLCIMASRTAVELHTARYSNPGGPIAISELYSKFIVLCCAVFG